MAQHQHFQLYHDFEVKNQILQIKQTFIEQNQQKNQIRGKINYDILIELHRLYGNRWKQISLQIPNTSDTFIKNMFYTFTRKSIRKINSYMEQSSKYSNKKTKTFKLNFVFKLANLAQSERINKENKYFEQQQQIFNHSIQNFYTKLLYNLLEIGTKDNSTIKKISKYDSKMLSNDQQELKQSIDLLIVNLKTIQKIFIEQNLTKKGRTKKKFPKKGLIQKAYSSKAFNTQLKNNELFDLISVASLSTHNQSKQFKQNQDLQQKYQQLISKQLYSTSENIHLIDTNQNKNQLKDQFDFILDQKTFDPILFE